MVPVLTYHAANIESNTYRANDHLALKQDLANLHRWGYSIVSLRQLFAWHQGQFTLEGRTVAISFDDGTDFDFHDIKHPACGRQRSMANILRDHSTATGQQVYAALFVVASPQARELLDQRGLVGRGWWKDDWWAAANQSEELSIECHSWDHLHPDLDTVAHSDNLKGNFSAVSSWTDCDIQFRQAGDYLASKMGGARPDFFAYPWGQYSEYMTHEYLPQYQQQHGFKAAFSTEPEAVTRAHSRWALPRFVCGRDWNSPEGLEHILRVAQ